MLPENTILGKLTILETFAYYDRPIFFLAENGKGFLFIVLLIDEIELNLFKDRKINEVWLYALTDGHTVDDLKDNKIDYRSAILKSTCFFEVTTGMTTEIKTISAPSEDDLPTEDAFYP